jgi:hypothetical protein
MSEHHGAREWISDVISYAVAGAIVAMLLNFVASLILPEEYWRPGDWLAVAAVGAAGAIGAMFHTRFRSRASRKPDNSS